MVRARDSRDSQVRCLMGLSGRSKEAQEEEIFFLLLIESQKIVH